MASVHTIRNHTLSESGSALPPGEWVLRRLVWVFNEAPIESRIDHGTERGYHQHRHYGIAQCDECREAHRLEWHANKRKAVA